MTKAQKLLAGKLSRDFSEYRKIYNSKGDNSYGDYNCIRANKAKVKSEKLSTNDMSALYN